MAILNRHDHREDWLKWAIQFMRRGLWLVDEVEVHGPHGWNADLMWGEAEVLEDGGDKSAFEVCFSTVRGITGIHDVRGVRIQGKDNILERFPVRPKAKLSCNARRWLTVATRVHARQIRERRKALVRTMS